MSEKGIKFDDGKPEMSNIPGHVLMAVCRVFNKGAEKYGKYNYRKGMNLTQYYDACQRHITAWLDGEDIDEEFGENHITHAICELIMLLANFNDGVGEDNRYKKTTKKITREVITASVAEVDDIVLGAHIGKIKGNKITKHGIVTDIFPNIQSDSDFVSGKFKDDTLGIKVFFYIRGKNHLYGQSKDYIIYRD